MTSIRLNVASFSRGNFRSLRAVAPMGRKIRRNGSRRGLDRRWSLKACQRVENPDFANGGHESAELNPLPSDGLHLPQCATTFSLRRHTGHERRP